MSEMLLETIAQQEKALALEIKEKQECLHEIRQIKKFKMEMEEARKQLMKWEAKRNERLSKKTLTTPKLLNCAKNVLTPKTPVSKKTKPNVDASCPIPLELQPSETNNKRGSPNSEEGSEKKRAKNSKQETKQTAPKVFSDVEVNFDDCYSIMESEGVDEVFIKAMKTRLEKPGLEKCRCCEKELDNLIKCTTCCSHVCEDCSVEYELPVRDLMKDGEVVKFCSDECHLLLDFNIFNNFGFEHFDSISETVDQINELVNENKDFNNIKL